MLLSNGANGVAVLPKGTQARLLVGGPNRSGSLCGPGWLDFGGARRGRGAGLIARRARLARIAGVARIAGGALGGLGRLGGVGCVGCVLNQLAHLMLEGQRSDRRIKGGHMLWLKFYAGALPGSAKKLQYGRG